MTTSSYPFELAPLPYDYAALEPHIDERTMRIHHDKHHRSYVDKLNGALKDHPRLHGMTLVELLRNLERVPEAIRTAVRDNGGGHLNHQLFWELIGPPGPPAPTGRLKEAIESRFGSLEAFRAKFTDVATKHFASGWTVLVADAKAQTLEIVSLPNHQCVLAAGQTVLLVCDVWEHAYYLKHQNRRPEYLDSWWQVASWPEAARRFERPDREAEQHWEDEGGAVGSLKPRRARS